MEVVPRYTHINISRQNVIKYLMSWLAVNIWWVEFYEFRALVLNMVLNFWIVDSIRNWWKLWNLCSDKSTFLSAHNFACILWISFSHVELNAHNIYAAYERKAGFPCGSEGKALPAMQESWVWSLGQEGPLEKEMATHSSTLAWKIP